MRKTLLFTLWAILILVVGGIALIFSAIANGEKDILVGSDSVYDFESTLPGVKKTAEFDFASIKNVSLGAGIDNKLTILIDNGYGKTITEYFIVRVVNLKMTVSGFDTNSVYNETNKPELRVIVYGSDAKVFAEVDGIRILDGGNTSDGSPETFDSSIFNNVNNAHELHASLQK